MSSESAKQEAVTVAERGISVTTVTKATLGSTEIAGALLRAGVRGLGDSRIENIEAMRRARIAAFGNEGVSVGSEMIFQLNYSALVRVMTSPFITKAMKLRP